MIKRYLIFLAITACCWILTACADGDFFKNPTAIEGYFKNTGQSAINGHLQIESATLSLTEIEINGQRSNAQDVFLNRIFTSSGGNFSLLTGDPNQPVYFDIPQGIYERLEFRLFLENDNHTLILVPIEEEDDDDLMVDLNEYFANAKPGILLKCRFDYNDDSYMVILAINDLLRLNLIARQSGNRQILLESETQYNANLQFNFAHWFGLITPEMLEDAETFEYEDIETIFIHKDFNRSLYVSIVNRIEESTLFDID